MAFHLDTTLVAPNNIIERIVNMVLIIVGVTVLCLIISILPVCYACICDLSFLLGQTTVTDSDKMITLLQYVLMIVGPCEVLMFEHVVVVCLPF